VDTNRGVVTSDVSLEGEAGLRVFREAIAETSGVVPLGDAAKFRVRSRVHHLGNAVLTDVQSSSLQYIRSARHVACAAYDHYEITVSLNAEIRYQSGRRSASVHPGDVIVLDSTRPTNAAVRAPDRGLARVPAIFVPRALVASMMSASGDVHLRVLRRGDPRAKLLSEHVAHMLERIDGDPQAQFAPALPILTGLIASAFGAKSLSRSAGEAMSRAALDALKRLIEEHIGSPDLDADLICARSGWSRATVYRLFQTEGGLARYIRHRRLHWAFRQLMSGGSPRRRIVDLAVDCQFASEATFSRAFHRLFGMPPGEVRALAERARSNAPSGVPLRAVESIDDADAIRWIKHLSVG
jgi:AraC-like DNA-binding protein